MRPRHGREQAYAINTALGRWHNARGKNAELARRLRASYANLASARPCHAVLSVTSVTTV